MAGGPIEHGGLVAKGDPRADPTRLLRVIPFHDGSRFILSRTDRYEPHAMVGTLLRPEGRRDDFRATEFFPPVLVKPDTAGQIFGAALLDDGRLALSIGWTNRTGRNINGIAILASRDGKWERERIIVMRGSVRDIAAGPAGSIAAVTTDFGRQKRERLLELLLIEADGRIRSRLETRHLSSDEAEKQALGIRLQRFSERSVVFFDIPGGVMFLLDIRPLCIETVRMLSLSAIPPEAEKLRNLTIDAARLHTNGALTVARHGFDGKTTILTVTTHGQNGQTTVVRGVSARSAVITEEHAEGVVLDTPVPHQVQVRVNEAAPATD
jgi:hypothetical protein